MKTSIRNRLLNSSFAFIVVLSVWQIFSFVIVLMLAFLMLDVQPITDWFGWTMFDKDDFVPRFIFLMAISIGLVNMSAEDHTYDFLCSIRDTFRRK